MRLVIVESPFAGKGIWPLSWLRRLRNIRYARMCVRDCVIRGEAPIASHLLFTQPGILRDEVPEERTAGIEAGLAWGDPTKYSEGNAPISAFYVNFGISRGMELGMKRAESQDRAVHIRSITVPWWMRIV